MKKLKILICVIVLASCSEWNDRSQFKVYIRDQHPYSKIVEMEMFYWTYQVDDTLNNEVWIYTSARSKNTVRSHCVNCSNIKTVAPMNDEQYNVSIGKPALKINQQKDK